MTEDTPTTKSERDELTPSDELTPAEDLFPTVDTPAHVAGDRLTWGTVDFDEAAPSHPQPAAPIIGDGVLVPFPIGEGDPAQANEEA